MKIHAITVCVDYAEHLRLSIDLWRRGLASLTVVTAPRDQDTVTLVKSKPAVRLHETDVFYAGGAFFNKGAAIQEARAAYWKSFGTDIWYLLIDADVIPPPDWYSRVRWADPHPACGILHGAERIDESGNPIGDRELAGFFQLWHSLDPRGKAPIDSHWLHAGNYDSSFMQRWPGGSQRILPLQLLHRGETGTNWCGKGNNRAMTKIREQRKRRTWRDETIRNVGKYS